MKSKHNLLYLSLVSYIFPVEFPVLNVSYEPGLHEIQLLEDFEQVAAQDIVEENALLYITGYVAHRFRDRYDDLRIPTKDLPNLSND